MSYYALLASPSLPPLADAPISRSDRAPAAFYAALRAFGLVVLTLMLASVIYAGCIAIENWSEISV